MTDKEIENFVNWLQSCTAKKFYSADAEDLIFEFKNQALRQHDVSGRSEQLVCTFCGINPIDEVCKHPKVCSEKKKVKAN